MPASTQQGTLRWRCRFEPLEPAEEFHHNGLIDLKSLLIMDYDTLKVGDQVADKVFHFSAEGELIRDIG